MVLNVEFECVMAREGHLKSETRGCNGFKMVPISFLPLYFLQLSIMAMIWDDVFYDYFGDGLGVRK